MKKLLFSLFTISVLLLSACGGSAPAQPTATSVPATATFTPTSTSTPEPTFTPTATPTPKLPVAFGTQMPAPVSAISADNLDQVVELARWGKGVITDAVYSPDGQSIAIATTLGVSLYQADTLEETIYFETSASVNSLAFSNNGESIATGLKDNTVKLWKVSDGTLLKSLDGHTDEKAKKDAKKAEVTSIAFSPDGDLIAGGSTDGTVSLWQVSDYKLENTFDNLVKKEVVSVFFSADGQSLFFASRDGKVRMVSLADGKSLQSFSAGRDISDAGISADGKIVAAYNPIDGQSLILWDAESGEKLQTIKGVDQYSSDDLDVALSPDGQYVAVAYRDHTAKVWSVSSGVVQNTLEDLRPNDGWYYLLDFVLSFSPDSQSLLLAGGDSMGTWDVGKSTLLNSAKIKTQGYESIALSPDGQTLAVIEGPDVKLMRLSDGSINSTNDLLQSNGSLAFSPDGSTLLVSMFDRTARLWPLNDQGSKKTFETEKKEYIWDIALSPDGQMLAMEETYTGKVELRRVSDGALIRFMKIGTSYGYSSLGFSPDGKILAAALNDQVRLFQVEDGKSLKLFKGGTGVSFSPDGTMLAGGDRKKNLMIWNIADGKVLLTVKDCPDVVLSTTFSPDGSLLVVGFWDGTVEIFRVSDGIKLKSWKAHSLGVTSMLFASDGKLLITASWDGTVRTWGLKP